MLMPQSMKDFMVMITKMLMMLIGVEIVEFCVSYGILALC